MAKQVEIVSYGSCQFQLGNHNTCGSPAPKGQLFCAKHQALMQVSDQDIALGTLAHFIKDKRTAQYKALHEAGNYKDLSHIVTYVMLEQDIFIRNLSQKMNHKQPRMAALLLKEMARLQDEVEMLVNSKPAEGKDEDRHALIQMRLKDYMRMFDDLNKLDPPVDWEKVMRVQRYFCEILAELMRVQDKIFKRKGKVKNATIDICGSSPRRLPAKLPDPDKL